MNKRLKGLIFLDFEYITTRYKENGKRVYLQEIIELGAVIQRQGRVTRVQKIIQPTVYLKIHKTNFVFNKFTDEELEHGVELVTALEYLSQFYNPKETLLVAWGYSDFYNLGCLCKKYNIKNIFQKSDYLDLSEEYRKFSNLKQPLALYKAIKDMGTPRVEDKHRALPDAEGLAFVFDKMIAQGFCDDILYLV